MLDDEPVGLGDEVLRDCPAPLPVLGRHRAHENVDRAAVGAGSSPAGDRPDATGGEPTERELTEGGAEIAAYDVGAAGESGLHQSVRRFLAVVVDHTREGTGELPVSAEARTRASASWSA